MRLYLFIIFIIFSCLSDSVIASGCTIDVQKLLGNQPIFLKPSKTLEFLFPNGYRQINLNNGEQIQLYCDQTFKSDSHNKILTLTCGKDNIEKYLECKDRNQEIARYTNKTCQYFRKDAYMMEIGFQINNDFIKIMEVCYDKSKEQALYSKYELGPHSGDFQMNVERELFKDGPFFPNLNVSRLYSKYIQKKTFETLLGPKSANLYFQKDYLARGHLAAMADFIYASQQLATFYYINVGPQWQSFNAGNWESFERSSRYAASKKNLDLDVYTGTYGVASLKSDHNTYVDLYLHVKGDEKKVPVPKIYFKILVDKATQTGIVLIGVNNPFATEEEIKKDYVICKDVKETIKAFKFSTDQNRGYTYACTVQDFVNTVKYLKFIKTKGILRVLTL